MYPAAPENVTRYYVLFVRVAIKQRAAQLRVFLHKFDTRPAVHKNLLGPKLANTCQYHVQCTNLSSFAVYLLLGIVISQYMS